MRILAKPGDRNNRLTLVSLDQKRRGGYIWKALCDCGNEIFVIVRDFRSGHTKSCGCFRSELLRQVHTTHGLTDSAEYRIWSHMRGRCNNPTDGKYPSYGGRGIKVCDRWNSFQNFLQDMGSRPTGIHSIDRIEVNGNYDPSNCRWATVLEQAQNKRNNVLVMVFGNYVVLAEAERLLQLGQGSITQKVRKHKFTHQEAATHFERRYVEMKKVASL